MAGPARTPSVAYVTVSSPSCLARDKKEVLDRLQFANQRSNSPNWQSDTMKSEGSFQNFIWFGDTYHSHEMDFSRKVLRYCASATYKFASSRRRRSVAYGMRVSCSQLTRFAWTPVGSKSRDVDGDVRVRTPELLRLRAVFAWLWTCQPSQLSAARYERRETEADSREHTLRATICASVAQLTSA